MAAHSFAMGCATVFFETAASATFLARFSAAYLPWIYVAAAGVNTITGATYARVQRRMSFARLMKGTLWFLLAIVVCVRVGFAASDVSWVVFAGLVSYRVISSLTDLEYWAVASRIYDVRQAKRLFGLIGTGEVIARILGAFSVPLLVRIGGVSNLMLVSAGALALCIVLLGAVLRPIAGVHDAPTTLPTRAQPASESRAGLRDIVGSRYLALVIGVAIAATFGKYFVDFAFLEQMSTVTKGEAQLATFLGIFNGLAQTVSLLTRVFVSRPFIHRFGIRVGVVVLPTMHALCTAATVVCGTLGIGGNAVFWLVIANQGIYKAFKHPIDNASFKVLYQPLKAAQRLAAQIAVEVMFAPVVVGVAGGVMLVFSGWMTYDPVQFSIVLFVNFVAWALLARAAGRGYAKKLVDNLRGRVDGNVAVAFDDATTMAVLRSRLKSTVPAEICVALNLLEKGGARDLTDTLISHVAHPSAIVRAYALERLVELHPSVLRGMRELRVKIASDPVSSVRRAGAMAVAASGGADAVGELGPYLRDPDIAVRRAAVAALFDMRGDDGARRAAIETVELYAASEPEGDRVLAARLAGEHALAPVLARLLDDPSIVVRRAALRAAGKLHGTELLDELVAALLDPRLAQAAVLGLAARGDPALELLAAGFSRATDRLVMRRLVDVFARAASPVATGVLRAHLAFADATVRGWILAALDARDYVARDAEKAAVLALVQDEVREATWSLGAIRDLAGTPELAPLAAALEGEVAAAGRRVFDLLAFVKDRVAVQRVAVHIAHGSKDKRAYAHEVLDLTLDARLRELVSPLLDDVPSAERLRRLGARFPQATMEVAPRLRALVDRSPRWQGGYTHALAIRATAARGITDGLGAWRDAIDPLVRQTVTWALARRERAPGSSERPVMLLIEKVIMLKTVPMFALTSEELLAEIAALLEEVEYRAGEVVFAKGEVGESMYIIVSGRVRVFDGEAELSILGDKEIFGELALLDPQPRTAAVEALDDARLFRLDGETFAQLMTGNPEIVRGVLHVLCERLRRTPATAGIV